MSRCTQGIAPLAALALLICAAIGCGGDAEPYTAPDYTPDDATEATDATEAAEATEPAEEAAPLSELALDVDPFCGMALVDGEITVTAEYDGKTYGFCCTHCRDRFLADPAERLAIHARRQEQAEERGEEAP